MCKVYPPAYSELATTCTVNVPAGVILSVSDIAAIGLVRCSLVKRSPACLPYKESLDAMCFPVLSNK